MIHLTIKKSINNKAAKKLNLVKWDIDGDGPMMFCQIVEDTFITTTGYSTFTLKEKFYQLDLKSYYYYIIHFYKDMKAKIMALKVAGHKYPELGLFINLFCAYHTTTNEEFKAHKLHLFQA